MNLGDVLKLLSSPEGAGAYPVQHARALPPAAFRIICRCMRRDTTPGLLGKVCARV